jgi:hypothetical protein
MDYVLLFVLTLRGQEISYETFKTSGSSTPAPRIMSALTTSGLSRSDLNERRLLRRTQRLRRQESGMYAYCSMSIPLFYATFSMSPTFRSTLYLLKSSRSITMSVIHHGRTVYLTERPYKRL